MKSVMSTRKFWGPTASRNIGDKGEEPGEGHDGLGDVPVVPERGEVTGRRQERGHEGRHARYEEGYPDRAAPAPDRGTCWRGRERVSGPGAGPSGWDGPASTARP